MFPGWGKPKSDPHENTESAKDKNEKTTPPKKRSKKFSVETLEPRIYLSATFFEADFEQPTTFKTVDSLTPVLPTESSLDTLLTELSNETGLSNDAIPVDFQSNDLIVPDSLYEVEWIGSLPTLETDELVSVVDDEIVPPTDGYALFPECAEPHSIVFIDSRIPEPDKIISTFPAETEIHFLTEHEDGINSISNVLAGKTFSAIHIVSHGSSGSLQLGSATLTSDSLVDYQDDLYAWKSSLTEEADILLYGCNIADSADGQGLLAEVARLTSADLAASTDLTGSSTLGGDWELEFQTGWIETRTFATDLFAADYQYIFANPTANSDVATAVEAGGVNNATGGTSPTGNVLTNDTDPDAGDTKTVVGIVAGTAGSAAGNVGATVAGTYGSILIGSDGTYTYTVNNSLAAVQALRTSANTLSDTFTYTMRDTAGGTSTTQITVTIQGANDTPYDLTGTLSVAENGANGTTVGTVTRSDYDSGDTASYSLVDNAGGRFSINSSSGVVTVANSSLLNYESATSHNITVRVTDASGASYDEVMVVNLADVNEFNIGSISDSNAGANTVAENAANGSTVGITALATDADGSSSVIYSLDNNAGGRFSINSATGVVTVANSSLLNYETATSFSITVRATSSDTSFSTTSYTINLTDVDEFDVSAISDTNATANSVTENAAIGTVVGITANASDADATNNSITYSLDDSSGGSFAINASTGVVTVANTLSYEDAASRSITVRATSSDGSFSTQTFSIAINDVAENVTLTAGNDTFTDNGVKETSVSAGDGDDVVFATDGNDVLYGGNGTDTLNYGNVSAGVAVNLATTTTQNTATAILYSEDFESGASGWSSNSVDSDGNLSDFLGNFGGSSGSQAVSKTYTLPNGLSAVTVEFDFYELDSWDSESFQVFVNNTQILSKAFQQNSNDTNGSGTTGSVSWSMVASTSGTAHLGGPSGYTDQIWRVTLTVTNPGTSLKLGFGSTLNEDTNNESYGIDNLVIKTNWGGAGNDLVQGFENLTGSSFADSLTGTSAANVLSGGGGNDFVTGAGGADTFAVTSGTDTIADLGNGADILNVSSGATANAYLSAAWTATSSSSNAGTATINTSGFNANVSSATGSTGWTLTNAGSSTAVTLTGSSFDDTLVGGSGADTLSGGAGNDTLTGGSGNDTFSITSGTDSITDFATGADILSISAGASVNATMAAAWTATISTSNSGSASLTTSGYNVNLASATGTGSWTVSNAASSTAVTLTGSSNSDTLIGGSGNDTIDGGAGNDTIEGGNGNDTLIGNSGIDTVSYANASNGVTVNLANTSAQNTTQTVITNETFESGASGWSSNTTTNGGSTFTNYLGGFAGSGGTQAVSKTYSLSSGYSTATVSFDFYEVDSWDGEQARFYVNDTLVFSKSLVQGTNDGNVSGTTGSVAWTMTAITDGTGNLNSGGWTDQIWRVTYTITNPGTSLKLGFGSTLDQAVADEAYGIDNLSISGGMTGSTGTDTLSGFENLTGSGYADVLSGDSNDNVINGGAGNDSIDGGSGNDNLIGGAGNDTLTGSAGNDTFTVDSGSDTIADLGNGSDAIVVSSGAIANSTLTGAWTASSSSNNAGTVNLTASGFNINTSAALGTGSWNLSNSGNSTGVSLTGAAGNDALTGGSGNDVLTGGAGSDTMTGGSGVDTFVVDSGVDSIIDLGNGIDILSVTAGATANATLASTWTATSSTTNSGSVNLTAAGFSVNVSNATGTGGWSITNSGNSTAVTLIGSSNADTFWGGNANDSFTGGAGADLFYVTTGTDSITDLGNGADNISVSTGATANATATAAWTAGVSTSNSGTATVNANGFNINLASVGGPNGWTVTNSGSSVGVSITGSTYNDVLTGGSGNDTLTGGGGNDSMTGGAGADTFIANSGTETIADLGNGADILTISSGATVNATVTAAWTATSATSNSGSATLSSAGFNVNVSNATGTSGWTISNAGSGTAVTLTGSANADNLVGGSGNDSLVGGAGNDTLEGGVGNDTLAGDAGTDTASYATAGSSVTVNLSLTSAQNTIGAGTDTLTGIENLTGSNFNDTLTGDSGNNQLDGGSGNDLLVGGQGNDVLIGGSGTDTVTLSGNWRDYTITTGSDALGNYYQLVDNVAGRDGTDRFYDVENFQFADGSVSASGIPNIAPVATSDTGLAGEAGGVANATGGSNATGNVLSNDTDSNSLDTKTVTGVVAGSPGSASGNVGSAVTGTYGSITINSNGSYTYVVDNSNATVQALRTSSNTLSDTFTYTVSDANGLTSTTTVTITIAGQNDAPSDLATTGLTVSENAVNGTVVGTLTRTDVDAGDGATYSLVNTAGGRFAINPTTGVVTVADGSLLNFESATSHSITVRVTDTAGATYDEVFTVNLSNTNEGPVANNDNSTAVEAGTAAGSNGTGNVLTNDTDVDAGDTKTVSAVTGGSVGAALTGTYGSVTIGADGSYTYVVDNSNATVQALRTSGNTLSESFTYTMRDAAGATSTATLTITITGQNDAPSDLATSGLSVSENAANGTVVGTLTRTDVDAGDGASYSLVDSAGGRFTINPTTGVVTVADGSLLNFESATSHSIMVRVTDTAGATYDEVFTVSLSNVNEGPVAVNDAGTAVEAGTAAGSNATGNVLTNDTDVDAGDTKTVSAITGGSVGAAITGTYGSVTIGADGSYTYVVDNSNAAVQALRTSGNTLSESFTYTMRDAAGATSTATLTITITGQNDAPSDLATSGLSVSENAANGTVVGTMTRTDVDAGDGATYSLVDTAGGRFAIDPTTGVVTVADGSLLNFESATSHSITVRVTDTAGATYDEVFTVNLTNANEGPVAVNDAGTAVEAGTAAGANATGNVLTNDTDVDAGDTKTVSEVTGGSVGAAITGTYGSVTIGADGSYTYVVDNSNAAVQALRTSGNTLTDSFTYTVRDTAGATSTATLTITITGQNDAPSDLATSGLSVSENAANGTVVGTLTRTDVDAGDGASYSLVDSAGGRFTINPTTGVVTVVDGSLLNFESATSHNITVRVTDTAGATYDEVFTVNLSNANEGPLAVNDNSTAVEAGTAAGANATGNVLTNDTDVDAGDTKTVSAITGGTVGSALTGTYGSVTVGADGSYTYVVDNSNTAVQALRTSGDTLSESFTYTIRDAAGATSTATLTITITGQNDAPSDLATSGLSVSENAANGTVVGTLTRTDVDAGDGATYSLVDTAGGRFAINPTTGVVTVADGSLLNFESATSHSITVRVTDTAGATYDEVFTVSLSNVNEGPVANNDNSTAVEAGTAAGANATGNVLTNDTDVDAGDTKTVSAITGGSVGSALSGTYGSVTIGADGSYTYVVDNSDASVQALRTSGDTLSESFTYTMRDAAGATSTASLTITITGQNDAPSDLATTGLTVTENAANGTVVGTMTRTDVDAGDAATYSLVDTAGGRFAIDPTTGVVTVADGSLLNFESATSHNITVRVTDTAGATYDEVFTVTLSNANEGPVANNDNSTAVEAGTAAGANATGNVLTNDTDVDAGDTKTVSAVTGGSVGSALSGTYGSVTIGADGSYTYVVDNSNSAVQALRTSGDTLSESFTYTMRDAAGATSTATLTITITGQNDAPSDLSTTGLTVTENAANGTVVGTMTRTDVDAGDGATYSLVDTAGGRFAIDPTTGVVTVADGSLLNFESATSHSITVRVTDTAGATYDEVFTVNLSNANEGPLAVNDNSTAFEAGTAAGANATGNVLTNDTDVDAGDTKTVSAVTGGSVGSALTGTYGSVTIGADGSYTYIVDNSNASVQALRTSGDTLSESFTYTMRDAAGATSTATLTITITGQNDAPSDLATSGLSVSENAANGTVVGTLTRTDVDAGDGASYSLVDSAGGRFTINPTTGVVTVVDGSLLNFESATSHNITVRVTDTAGATYDEVFTVNLSNANEGPIANNDNSTAVEAGTATGANGTGNVLTNDTDVDAGDTKTVSAITGGSVGAALTGTYGSVTIGADGSYTYVVDNSDASVQALRTSGDMLSESFTYTMRDAAGATSTATLTITITGQNDAPSDLASSGLSVSENAANGTVVGTMTRTDVDAGDGATYSLVDSAGGRFAIAPTTGVVTVADGSLLNFESATSHNITVRVTDTAGATYDEVFTVNLSNVNEGPIASNDNSTAVEAGTAAGANATGNVLTNDTDVDAGDTKTVSAITGGSVGSALSGTYGSVTIGADGSYTYIVDNSNSAVQALRTSGDTLSESFTYTMRDAAGATSTATLTITITGQNDAPSDLSTTGLTVTENAANGTVVGTLTRTDVDAGDGATYSLVDTAGGRFAIDPTTGVVTVADGSLLNFESATSHSITVRVTDTAGATYDEVFTVNLSNANEGPIANNDNSTAVEAGTAAGSNGTGNVLTNDTDVDAGDTKTVSAITGGTVGSALTGTYGSVTVGADGSYTYVVDNSDASVQALRTSGDTLSESFTYTMRDAAGATSTATLTITITGQNDAPSDLATSGLSVSENAANGTVVGTLTRTDVDAGDGATYSLVDTAGGRFAIDPTTGVVTVADGSLLNFESATSHNITVRVTDTAGATYDEVFTVNLSNANEGPLAVNDNSTAVEAGTAAGANATGNVLTNDTDVDAGDTKTVSAVTGGSVGSALSGTYGSVTIGADGSYTYVVDNSNASVQALRTSGDTLSESFTYTMRDAAGATSTATLTITITGQNDAPSDLATSGLSVSENAVNGTVVGTLTRTDVDAGDAATYSLVDTAGGRFAIDPTTGVVTVADGSLLNFESAISHNITVRVTDTAGATYDEVFTVTLSNANEGPVANNDNSTAVEAGTAAGSNATGNVLTNDTDVDAGDTKTVSAVTGGSVGSALSGTYGSVTIGADGSYTYVVDNSNSAVQALRTSGDTLSESFTYTMRDAAGATSTATLTITITGQNDAPIDVSLDNNSILENSAIGTTVGRIQVADVDGGDQHSIVLLDDGGGRFTLDSATGELRIASDRLLDFEVNAIHSITVQVTDLAGQTSQRTLSISVLDQQGERISSTSQNDTMNGGIGVDTAVFSGNWNDYRISRIGQTEGFEIEDLRSGSPDGLDVVSGFEVFEFADGSLATPDVNNVAPTDITSTPLTITENSSTGSLVGTAVAVDNNLLDTHTYQLLDDANGRFSIDVNSGEIRVADHLLLDFEQNGNHNIVVEVTDSAGAKFSKSLQISILNANPETVVGDTRDNSLVGGNGNDSLYGQGGDDTLVGGAGNDVLNGGTGDDFLVSGTGDDSLIGGSGYDVADLSGNSAGIELDLGLGQYQVGSNLGSVVEVEEIRLGGGDDIVRITNPVPGETYFVKASAGRDTLDLSQYLLSQLTFENGKITVNQSDGSQFSVLHEGFEIVLTAEGERQSLWIPGQHIAMLPNLTFVTPSYLEQAFSIDGQSVTLLGIQSGPHITVSATSDGRFVIVPENGFFGNDQFSFTLQDESGRTYSQTFSVEIKSPVRGLDLDADGTPKDASGITNGLVSGRAPTAEEIRRAALKSGSSAEDTLTSASSVNSVNWLTINDANEDPEADSDSKNLENWVPTTTYLDTLNEIENESSESEQKPAPSTLPLELLNLEELEEELQKNSNSQGEAIIPQADTKEGEVIDLLTSTLAGLTLGFVANRANKSQDPVRFEKVTRNKNPETTDETDKS